jgi:hypothetical protein
MTKLKESTEMTFAHTIEYGDRSDLLDALDDTAMALEALGVMLEFALRSGEDLRNNSDGIWLLVRQQCEDLKLLRKALRGEFDDLAASKLKLRNLDQLADIARVPPHVAKLVVELATGIKLAGAPTPKQAPVRPVHQFNEEFGGSVAPGNKEPTQ